MILFVLFFVLFQVCYPYYVVCILWLISTDLSVHGLSGVCAEDLRLTLVVC